MTQEDRCLEENVARLVRTALGPDARPGAQAGKRVFHTLLSHARARRAEVAFPDVLVGLLGGVFALAAVWWVVYTVVAGAAPGMNPLLAGVTAGLVLNLALVPVASVVVVMRRRNG